MEKKGELLHEVVKYHADIIKKRKNESRISFFPQTNSFLAAIVDVALLKREK